MKIPQLPLVVTLCVAACEPIPSSTKPTRADSATQPSTSVSAPLPEKPRETEPAFEFDGDDDPAETGEGELPAEGHFVRVGRTPLSLRRVCDLTPFGDSLFGAHANEPLGMDGATITRYQPEDTAKPLRVAFDWNRPGEPSAKGGAGQGFLRIHAIDGRLYVPDADPPNNGFGISEPGTEGFVFVSNAAGEFAPARAPHLRPPEPPAEGRAGAGIVPRAYHVLDAIRFRGRLYASTGSVPPSERAWHGAAPGALHVASEDASRWTYEVDYPYPWRDGVWRLTFLVRFRGRLYAGLQDYDGRDPNDYVVFDPPVGAKTVRREHAQPVRATRHGGAQTVRWYADQGKLYWIALSREGTVLRVTDEGSSWRAIAFPKFAGRPTDITRFRTGLVVLTERGLYRLEGETPVLLAKVRSQDGTTPFEAGDWFCSAPLAVYRNELYAGGQRDGALYKLVED